MSVPAPDPQLSADRVGVIGAGTMGTGIAYVFVASGATVHLVEPDADRRAQARAEILRRAQVSAERGYLTAQAAAAAAENLRTVDAVTDLPADLDLIVEAVPERMALKHAVLGEIEQRTPRLIGSNTSSLPISEVAATLADPTAFIGMHFFNPVWAMELLELVVGAQTAATTVAAAHAIGAQIGKQTIEVRDVPGFATSRLGVLLGLEATRMVEDGVASPADIDKAMVLGYRHPVGPLHLSDVVGLDVRLDIAEHLAATLGPRFTPPELLREMVARGDLGQKSGRGFFDWSDR